MSHALSRQDIVHHALQICEAYAAQGFDLTVRQHADAGMVCRGAGRAAGVILKVFGICLPTGQSWCYLGLTGRLLRSRERKS